MERFSLKKLLIVLRASARLCFLCLKRTAVYFPLCAKAQKKNKCRVLKRIFGRGVRVETRLYKVALKRKNNKESHFKRNPGSSREIHRGFLRARVFCLRVLSQRGGAIAGYPLGRDELEKKSFYSRQLIYLNLRRRLAGLNQRLSPKHSYGDRQKKVVHC